MSSFKYRKNLLAAVLLPALLAFCFFSIGGEIVHRLTDHYSNYAAEDNCPVHQLQTQALILIVAFYLVLLVAMSREVIFTCREFILVALLRTPFSQAPPGLYPYYFAS